MNELDKLLEDYSIASDTPTEVIKTSLEQEGENYVSFMQDYLKKKDNPNQNLATGNPQSEMDLTTSVPISQDLDLNQAQIEATNQVENPTLQSSDILPQQDSTDLPLIQTASSGLESSNTSQPTFKPFDSGVIANPITTNQSEVDEYNRYVQNRNRSITPSTINATQNTKTDSKGRKAIFSFGDDEVLDVLAGKPNDIQGDITPRLATQEELDADNAKILEQENQFQLNSDKETQDFFDKYLNKGYNGKLKEFEEGSDVYIDKNVIDNNDEYVNRILEREKRGEVKVARNDKGELIDRDYKVITDNILWQPIGKENIEDYNREVRNYNSYVGEQNVDSARFNYGNIGNEPEQDSYGEFVTKANDLGVLLSNEDSENITTYEDRQNFLATLEATNNAQKNGTTLQSELDKLGSKYLLSEEDKIANGYDGINLITNGIKDGKVKDKEESDFFNKFFTQKENVLDFGEYWNNEGKAKYGGSQVRENQANYQNYRANIFNDFLSYKNDKYGTDMRFIEEAVTKSSNLADRYYADGDFNAANIELAKVEKLYNQYNNNEANRQNISNIYTESNKAFTTYNKQKKEEAEFQLKVENGEFVANAKNILGQVALGVGSSVTSTITGLGRIVSSALPSDNLKDGLDIISDTELKVGNVKVASLTNKIKEFVGSDGLKYKEINGVTYLQNSDGKLSKNGYVQSGNEKVTKEDVEYNYGAGLTFVTSKMGADILITNAVGGGINRVLASSSTRLSNLKNIEKVFGLDSQVAKNAQSFTKLAKNTDNISVTGWYVQMYNDSYKMAEEGGINGNVNKHIYAMTQSLMQSVIQRINPDINFLKSMNTESRQIVRALMTNNKDKAIQLFSAFAKKAGNNVAKETGEEVIQQVVQDFNNVVINKLADTQLATTDAQGYKEVVFATVVPSIVASLMGGKGSRISNINNKEIDLTTYSRLDLITELARDEKGIEIVKDFKDTSYFQSQKQLGSDLENQIITAQKQIEKIPERDKYSTSALSEAIPILQEIEKKKESLKTDDGTFSKKINEEIDLLVTKVNSILDNDSNPVTNNNAENPQSTPQSEAVQEQTNGTKTSIDLNAKTGDELYQTESTDNNLNQQDGSAPVQIESPNAQTQEDGQGSQEGRSIATDQLTEMGEGNQESEQVAAEIASEEEVNQISKVNEFNTARDISMDTKSPQAVGKFILNNADVGDVIIDNNGNGYEVFNVTNKGNVENRVTIVPFIENNGKRTYQDSSARVIDKSFKNASELFDSTNGSEKYNYIDVNNSQQTPVATQIRTTQTTDISNRPKVGANMQPTTNTVTAPTVNNNAEYEQKVAEIENRRNEELSKATIAPAENQQTNKQNTRYSENPNVQAEISKLEDELTTLKNSSVSSAPIKDIRNNFKFVSQNLEGGSNDVEETDKKLNSDVRDMRSAASTFGFKFKSRTSRGDIYESNRAVTNAVSYGIGTNNGQRILFVAAKTEVPSSIDEGRNGAAYIGVVLNDSIDETKIDQLLNLKPIDFVDKTSNWRITQEGTKLFTDAVISIISKNSGIQNTNNNRVQEIEARLQQLNKNEAQKQTANEQANNNSVNKQAEINAKYDAELEKLNQNETQEKKPEQVVAESSATPKNITNETDIASVPQQDENNNQVAEDIDEDDIVLADDTLDLINSLSLEDETAQIDNTTTDGNIQLPTNVVQQQGENNDTKTTIEPTTSEGEVEVAPTETQATVLTEAERGRNDLVGMKTAYNKLSKAKKNQEDGKLMFARINELGKKLGYPIGSMGDGKISIKNPKTGKEMAKVKETFSEKIPTKKEVATAKKHLEDVAVWDGEVYNDHWESDLTWAEIRRGKQDIDNGKLNTVPARRLVNEINRQINDYGGFNFTKGAGAITDKTLISLEEIEDSKQAFPKVWNNLDLLTTQELENLYNERAESEADFYKNRALQDENNSVYEDRQEVQGESSGNNKGETELASDVNLQSTDKQFTPITQKAYNKLVDKLLDVFKKFGGKVETDLDKFKAKAEALGLNASEIDLMVRAFHGSPYSFDRFTTDKMGTGEGAQAFGWGLYFTDIKSIAETYAIKLNRDYKIKNQSNNNFTFNNSKYETIDGKYLKDGKEISVKEYFDDYEKLPTKTPSNLYNVSLHKGKTPEQYSWLEWDKPLNKKAQKLIDESGILNTEETLTYTEKERVFERDNEWFINGVYGSKYKTQEQALSALRNVLNKPILTANQFYGEGLYKKLSSILGGDKQASLFLLENGIDGVKYPAESISRGATSDNARGFNYVVFDENAITIEEKVQFMKTANGEIYGAKLPDGTIYLNPEKVNANTPIHEFSHLWQQLMPTRFKQGVELLKNTPIGKKTFAELKQNEGYANKNDAELWNEALVTVMGNEGERIFNSSKASKLKTWITDLFKKLGDAFGIRNLTPVDNLSVFVKGALKEVMGDKEIFAENGLQGNNQMGIDFSLLTENDFDADGNVKPEVLADIEAEKKSIIEKAKADGTYLKAPNGKKTKLNEEQWVSVRTDRFKNWFGDWENDAENASKVVDANGEPMVVYHGTGSNFDIFHEDSHFGTPAQAKGMADLRASEKNSKPIIKETFLNIRNPKESYDAGDDWEDIISDALYEKYDGIKYLNIHEGNFKEDSFIAFNPNQIKSATSNAGTYSNKTGNIDFSIIGEKGAKNNPKPTYLMPKSLIEGITSSIRNGGKSDDIIDLAKDSKWFNSLSEKKQNEFSVNDVKQIVVDSVNYYKGADAVKLQETKDKAKAKLDKEKSESKAKEKASREKLADVRQESKDKIIKLRDKYKEKIAILRDENKDLRVKRFERKAIVRETIYELKSLLIGNNIDGRVTPSEISRLIRLASEVGASAKPTTALDTFFKEYAKIQEKAEARMEVQKNKELTADEYNQLKDIVEELLDKKTGTETIKDLVKTLNLPFSKANSISKEVYTTIDKIIARYETNQLSDEESANLLKDAYQQSKDNKNKREDERTKIEKVSDGLKKGLVKAIEKYSDRQFKAKELLNKIGALNTYNRLINSAGSSAKASELHTKIYDKVFKGLSNDARVKLNQIIVARRIIAIEKNRAERDLSPINHTNNITLESAEKALKQFESENKAEYDDLIARSKGYFKAFDYQLDQMLENGLITQEAYNGMKGVDYQPRMFLEHIADYQGNVEDGIGGTNYNTAKKGVDSKVIQSLDEGSIGKMVMDADWILRVAIASNTKMSAMNEVNMVFITKELPLAQSKYDLIQTVDADKRTREDNQFIKYFENLRSQVKENPIKDYSKQGNPIFTLNEKQQGFTKNYFYVNGVRNEFFLADELHNIWNDIYEKRITKEVESNVISKTIFTAPTKLTKLMATGINPLFFIVNTPRDFFQIVDFSEAYSNNVLKGATTLALDTFKAYKDTMMHDRGSENTMYAKYIEYGGGMDFLATQGKFDKKYADKNKILSALDTINTLSKYSEIGFRIATFSRATQNGLKAYNKENGTNYKTVEEIPNTYDQDNIYHNAVRTARSVMDFNQGGKTAKDLDSMLPYLNASIQGTRSMVDAMRKRPYETSFRMAQTATYMTGLVFGLMYGLFSLFDDDDEDKEGVMSKIIDAYSRITPTQRANSWNIVLPNKVASFLGFTLPEKKDIGEYYVLKIAKTQALAPLLYTFEEGFLNIAKISLGMQQRSYLDIGKEATGIANKNLLPFELANPTDMLNSLVSKNFVGKAYITSVFGYDTYRNEKLSADIGLVPRGAEGLGNPNVEEFYKDFGKVTGYSPVRTKAIVEGLVTSPQTNPYVMATYTGLNVVTNAMSKEDKEVISGKMVNDLKRMATGRLISQTSQYAKSLSTSTKNNKEKFEEVDYAYAERRAMVKELSTGLANGTMTKEYADQKVNDLKLTPNETKNLFNQINERLANKNVDSELFSIKYDRTSAEGKALRLIEAYPNINLVTDRTPEALEIKAQIHQIGGIATDDVNTYYKKLIKEREEK